MIKCFEALDNALEFCINIVKTNRKKLLYFRSYYSIITKMLIKIIYNYVVEFILNSNTDLISDLKLDSVYYEWTLFVEVLQGKHFYADGA